MKLILYMCEGNFETYIQNIEQNNELFLIRNAQTNLDENKRKLIDISFLQTEVFDYVIIMSRDWKKTCEIEKFLLDQNVFREKILRYYFLEKNPMRSPIEGFMRNHCSDNYEILMFGMSHSYGGFIDCIFNKEIYKFSAPSMDLYYHYMVLKEIIKVYDLSKVKKIIFELPYYAFNYDISMCKQTFLQRMNYYIFLGDYHHYGENYDEMRHITEFEVLNQLCYEPWYTKADWVRNMALRSQSLQIWKRMKKSYWKFRYFLMNKEKHYWTTEEKESLLLEKHVWYKNHEKTIKENYLIWEKIKKLINQYKNIEIKVIVFPFCPYFIASHKQAIDRMQELFLEKLDLSKEQVIDCFNIFGERPEYFLDECHLNTLGATKFTKKLNKILK